MENLTCDNGEKIEGSNFSLFLIETLIRTTWQSFGINLQQIFHPKESFCLQESTNDKEFTVRNR